VVPVLLLITLGIIQFGIIFAATNAVTQVARTGGRYAAVAAMKQPGEAPLGPTEDADAYIRRRMNEAATAANLSPADISVVVSPEFNQRRVGSPVTITLIYNLRKKVFLPAVAGAVPSNYTKTSVFMLEGQ
jgi:Flp pilus assembly protein TadG